MERSRRDVLRAGGAAVAAVAAAGCIEERVTRRETRARDTNTWSLSPDEAGAALGADAFGEYTDRMADRYGDGGVWGLGTERPEGFEEAYVQRYAIVRETPGSPTRSEFSLVPDEVDPEAPVLIADAAVARYAVGEGRYRYWLWAAADPTDDRLVRDVDLTTLSTGLRLRRGNLVDAASPSVAEGEASVGLSSPPSGRFPVAGGSLGTTTRRGAEGIYAPEWTGELAARQSVAGVCETEREGAYDLAWTLSLGYGFEGTV